MAKAEPQPLPKLPKRFRPYQRQAATQADLRYGAQESALESIFGRTTSNYQRQATAQRDMGSSLLGSLNAAPKELNRVYSEAGLSPEILAGAANNPTLAKLAGELARQQAGFVEQKSGAQAGQQYIQQRLADDYREDVGSINQQASSMARERGLYESSLLDELIGEDRSRRSAANAAEREARFAAEQNILDRQAAQDNALIGQGLLPDEKGNLQPLPGGKADPSTKKPKKPSKPSGADRTVQSDFRSAASWIKRIDNPGFQKKLGGDKTRRRAAIEELLRVGEREAGMPAITSAGLDAALDMYFDKALSAATVKALHDSGAKVKFLGGVKTAAQRRNERRTLPMGGRQGTARSRSEQLG